MATQLNLKVFFEMDKIKLIYEFGKTQEKGFTVDLNGNPVECEGFVVALRETQNSFEFDGLVKAYNVAKEKGIYVGGWYEQDTGLYYFDACVIVETFNEAVIKAIEEGQRAFYDLKGGKEYNLRDLIK